MPDSMMAFRIREISPHPKNSQFCTETYSENLHVLISPSLSLSSLIEIKRVFLILSFLLTYKCSSILIDYRISLTPHLIHSNT